MREEGESGEGRAVEWGGEESGEGSESGEGRGVRGSGEGRREKE